MYYNVCWYDPALGRFAQADAIVPASVQGYDRYAYVNNNPVRYVDPTGHYACGDGEDRDCDGNPGNFVGGGELINPCHLSSANAQHCQNGSGNSSGEPDDKDVIDKTIGPHGNGLPQTVSLTLLSGNMVQQEIVYDYNYFPPKPIGEIRISYAKDGDIAIDYVELLGTGADELVSSAVKYYLEKKVKETLGELTGLFVCPECAPIVAAYEVYQVVSNVAKVNNAITIESHLQVKTIYYQAPLPSHYMPEMPVYWKIR